MAPNPVRVIYQRLQEFDEGGSIGSLPPQVARLHISMNGFADFAEIYIVRGEFVPVGTQQPLKGLSNDYEFFVRL